MVLDKLFAALKAMISEPTISGSIEFKATGYKTMKNRDRLIDAICTVYDKAWIDDHPYKPQDGVTYCNFAVQDVARIMGYKELDHRLANEIIDFISASKDWSKVEMNGVQQLANSGSLVIAGQYGEKHGHVAVVRPGLSKWSTKWNCPVPSVMNIGKDCFISKGVNWAFQDIPLFFVWKESI